MAAEAFKEWAAVCAHLAAGTTSLLLRKGGIHEGRAGFSFNHERFFLFPTAFHEAAGGLREPPPAPHPPADPGSVVEIRLFAVAEFALRVRSWPVVESLAPFHPWAPQVVAERFNYSEKLEAECISVAFIRVFRLAQPWRLAYEPGFGGCRSWIRLPDPPAGWEQGLVPVLAEAAHAERRRRIREIAAADPAASGP
jgi:hypothetical protein